MRSIWWNVCCFVTPVIVSMALTPFATRAEGVRRCSDGDCELTRECLRLNGLDQEVQKLKKIEAMMATNQETVMKKVVARLAASSADTRTTGRAPALVADENALLANAREMPRVQALIEKRNKRLDQQAKKSRSRIEEIKTACDARF